MDSAILHGNILTPGGVMPDGAILVRNGKIVAVLPSAAVELPPEVEVYDAQGLTVSPGFIDAHSHGGIGFDFMTCTPLELERLLAWLPSTGVTGILPTLASCPQGQELEMVRRLTEAQRHPSPGAKILGLHLEGPYISPGKRGAQPADPIRLPDLTEMRQLVAASEHTVRLVTLAPELPGAVDLVRYLVSEGIVASAGHTEAVYEDMQAAVHVGLSRVAHLYNGVTAFHHRLPGVIGAALEMDALYVELILDGMHLVPAVARVTLKAKGASRVVLMTDATQAAGLGDGVYIRPGNRKIIVKDGAARLESGSLAGSVLTMNRAVANAMRFLGVSISVAAGMASANAAESLHLPAKGKLAAGYDADIIVFDDQVCIQAAFVDGKMVFQKPLSK